MDQALEHGCWVEDIGVHEEDGMVDVAEERNGGLEAEDASFGEVGVDELVESELVVGLEEFNFGLNEVLGVTGDDSDVGDLVGGEVLEVPIEKGAPPEAEEDFGSRPEFFSKAEPPASGVDDSVHEGG